MTQKRKRLGEAGEEIALTFLKKKGYKILYQNYRCCFGEIDIIAQHKKILTFIEVKTRSTKLYGAPHEAVSLKKQRKICQVALEFIQRHRLEETNARFDVVAIQFSPEGPRVDFIENAFELVV